MVEMGHCMMKPNLGNILIKLKWTLLSQFRSQHDIVVYGP